MPTAPIGRARKRLFERPKPVIERWMSRKMTPKFYAVVRAYMRWKLPRTERARRKVLEAAFNETKDFAHRYEGSRYPAMSVLCNIGLYLLLAERDIQAVKIDALTHPDEWTRKLHARIILLTIYEWDADKVAGKKLRQALDTIQAPDELKQTAIKALRTLRAVQEKVTKQFAFVRNNAIAHRNPDALAQYRAIRDLKVEEVLNVAKEFYVGINQFMAVLPKLILASGTLPAILRQWSHGVPGRA